MKRLLVVLAAAAALAVAAAPASNAQEPTFSYTTAAPCPTPMHIVARP